MLRETFLLALSAVHRNALRSCLTLLGIVIGVAAVIAMVTIGDGTTSRVQEDLTKLGSNLLIIRPGIAVAGPGGVSTQGRSFTERDINILRSELKGWKALAPYQDRQVQIIYGGDNLSAQAIGTDADFFIARDWAISSGRIFSDVEVRSASSVCVIGQTVVDHFHADQTLIGNRLRIGKMSCEIIGFLEAKGQSAFGADQDSVVIMPSRTFQHRISGNTNISSIYISATNGDQSAQLQEAASYVLRDLRHIQPGSTDDFTIRDTAQIVATLTSTTKLMTGLLSAVAGVSLLVGGIGIMNIMLVSVTERTREIGIRLAIGAVEAQILGQFLVEAIVLALIGGIVGIFVGLSLAGTASYLMDIPFKISLSLIVIAFVFCGLIGIVFGFFPARRAARLDPIDALRHE